MEKKVRVLIVKERNAGSVFLLRSSSSPLGSGYPGRSCKARGEEKWRHQKKVKMKCSLSLLLAWRTRCNYCYCCKECMAEIHFDIHSYSLSDSLCQSSSGYSIIRDLFHDPQLMQSVIESTTWKNDNNTTSAKETTNDVFLCSAPESSSCCMEFPSIQ